MHDTDNARTIHQVAADMLRKQDRQKKSLHARLQEVTMRASLLSGVPSSQGSDAGYTTSGKTGSTPPPGLVLSEKGAKANTSEFRADSYLAPIEHHIERFEEAVDDELGLGQARHHATKTGSELDAEILAWEGVPSHVVATKAPHLGSPRTIERVRAANDRRPTDGREKTLRAA